MKAVIVEIRNKFVAAMTDDGRIIQLNNKNYEIGQVIEMKKVLHSYPKLIASAASIAAVIAVASVSVWAYTTPYSYVSLDVNPSIEYSLNRFDRVLSAEAVNDDGEVILENLDLENKSIEDAVEETIQEIAKNGYLTDTELGGIVIATSSDDEDTALLLADTLKEEAETTTAEAGIETEVEVLSIGKERVEEAKALGVTPGKLNLVEKLQASNPDAEVSIEDWLNKPVKSIMKAIKENKKADTAAVPEDDTAVIPSVTTAVVTDASVTATPSKTVPAAVTEQQQNKKKVAAVTDATVTGTPSETVTTVTTAATEQQKNQEKIAAENENKNKNNTTTTVTDVPATGTIKSDPETTEKVKKEQETEKSTSNNASDKQEKQNNGKSN